MNRLKNISAFRLILISLITIYLNKPLFFILFSIIYLIMYKFETLFYIFLVLIIFCTNNYRIDFIKYGLVEYKVNNYYVVNKLLYKTKIYNDDLNVGDIIYTIDSNKTTSISDLKKNIIFIENDYDIKYNLKFKKELYDYINSFDVDTSLILNKYLFNINDYDNLSFNIGYGLASYYFFNELRKKSNKLAFILIILYSILFSFDIKFILIIINILLENSNLYSENKYALKLVIISIFNIYLFNNYSILLPLLFNLYSIYSFELNFLPYLLLIEILLFNEINLLYTVLFIYFKKFRIFTFLLNIFLLFIPILEDLFIKVFSIYSSINSIRISIRGSLGIISLLIIFLLNKKYKLNTFFQSLLIILLTLIPLNSIIPYVSFIDVGQGDSILISNSLNKNTIMIDTGSKYNYYKLKKYLFRKGIYKIDYLIITHNDDDHNGNINNLKNDFIIKEIVLNGKDIEVDNVFLKYLYLGDYDNDNDNSLVYIYEKEDISFLFTGDISKFVEKEFVRKYQDIKIDVLKASHHGSYTGNSELFIGTLLPRYCIISTSGKYNHPHYQTIDNLEKYLVKYYTTKDSKTISFYLSKYLKLLHTDKGEFVIIS